MKFILRRKRILIALWLTFFLSSCVSPCITCKDPLLFTNKESKKNPKGWVIIKKRAYEVYWEAPNHEYLLLSKNYHDYELRTGTGDLLDSFTYDINKFGEKDSDLLWYAGYSPILWTPDSRFVYLTCLHGNENSSVKYFGNTFLSGPGIFRYDPENRMMVEVLPELRSGYYSLQITKDGSTLVYANENETPVTVKLLDLKTYEEQILFTGRDEQLEIGGFGFDDQGEKLVYLTMEMSEDQTKYYTLGIVDLSNNSNQILVQNITTWLRFESWDEQDQILLKDGKKNLWVLDIQAKTLTQQSN